MPKLPPKPCTKPGCKAYSTKAGRCDEHQVSGWSKRGSGSSRGYGWQWSKTRDAILERDKHLCQQCIKEGRLSKATEVDHIKPKFEGGGDEHDNLISLCYHHHKTKSLNEANRGKVDKRNNQQ